MAYNLLWKATRRASWRRGCLSKALKEEEKLVRRRERWQGLSRPKLQKEFSALLDYTTTFPHRIFFRIGH